MAKVKVVEGAGAINVYTQNPKDAETWRKRLAKNRNFKSVIVHQRPKEPKYKYIVGANKRSTWFSDEWPFRAGARLLIKRQG